MELRYLYVGTSNTERDLVAWLAWPGARLMWRKQRFGADVAAIELGSGARVMLADHRPAGSVLPIFAVDVLDVAIAKLESAGWVVDVRLETPEGPSVVLRDTSGTEIAALQVDRPDVFGA